MQEDSLYENQKVREEMSRTKDWLQYSQELKDIAELLMNQGRFSWSCFTSQQASAAALKAILSSMDVSTFGDNLIALLRQIGEDKEIPLEIKKACQELNDYFKTCRDLESKSTGVPSENFTLEEAQKAINQSLAIIRFAYQTAK